MSWSYEKTTPHAESEDVISKAIAIFSLNYVTVELVNEWKVALRLIHFEVTGPADNDILARDIIKKAKT